MIQITTGIYENDVVATLYKFEDRFLLVRQLPYGYDKVYFYPSDTGNLKFITIQLVNKINYYIDANISLLILFTGLIL